MQIRFWGVRGSQPVPGAATAKVGGNTSCLEITAGSSRVIIDAGTGLAALGSHPAFRKKSRHHLLLSHFHLDHLCGLPFFAPFYESQAAVHLYGPGGLKRSVASLLAPPYFPVPLKKMPCVMTVSEIGVRPFRVGIFKVTPFVLNHPGRTLGYVLEASGSRVAYVCDHEPIRGFNHLGCKPRVYEKQILEWLQGSDILIHDAHYFASEYPRYRGWGHSSWEDAIVLAEKAGVEKLLLTHHAPHHTDAAIRQAFQKVEKKRTVVSVLVAREGLKLNARG